MSQVSICDAPPDSQIMIADLAIFAVRRSPALGDSSRGDVGQ